MIFVKEYSHHNKKSMRRKKVIIDIWLTLITLVSMNCFAVCQNIDFSDSVFKDYLLLHEPVIDLNGDQEISIEEAEQLLTLKLRKRNATAPEFFNLGGIQFFKNLNYIEVLGHDFDSIDLSIYKDLTFLSLESDSLFNVNIDSNLKLEDLFVSGINISKLNVSNALGIKRLAIGLTMVPDIDLSSNKKITRLVLNSTEITEVDISNQVNLDTLILQFSGFMEVDLSQNLKLEVLRITSCNFSNIDISKNVLLKEFDGRFNNLEALDVSNNKELRNLSLGLNNLSSLDISNNPKLERLSITSNQIDTISLKNNPLLQYFYGDNNKLKNVDFSMCPELEYITLRNTCLENLIIVNTNLDFYYSRKLFIENNYYTIRRICADEEDSLYIANILFELYYSNVEHNSDCPDACFNLSTSANDNLDDKSSIILYPNPVDDMVTVATDLNVHSFNIYNLNGEIETKSNSQEFYNDKIDVSNLTNGIYIIRFDTADGLFSQKILINHN